MLTIQAQTHQLVDDVKQARNATAALLPNRIASYRAGKSAHPHITPTRTHHHRSSCSFTIEIHNA